MHKASQPKQRQDETAKNYASTVFFYKPNSHRQTLGDKIAAFLENKSTESNPDMIEKFYFRLLPVTYRDWMNR